MVELRYYISEYRTGLTTILVKIGGGKEIDANGNEFSLRLQQELHSLNKKEEIDLVNGPGQSPVWWERKLTSSEEREFLTRIKDNLLK